MKSWLRIGKVSQILKSIKCLIIADLSTYLLDTFISDRKFHIGHYFCKYNNVNNFLL